MLISFSRLKNSTRDASRCWSLFSSTSPTFFILRSRAISFDSSCWLPSFNTLRSLRVIAPVKILRFLSKEHPTSTNDYLVGPEATFLLSPLHYQLRSSPVSNILTITILSLIPPLQNFFSLPPSRIFFSLHPTFPTYHESKFF